MGFLEACCLGRAPAQATVKRSLTARPPIDLFSVNGAERMLWLQEAKDRGAAAFGEDLPPSVIDSTSLGAAPPE